MPKPSPLDPNKVTPTKPVARRRILDPERRKHLTERDVFRTLEFARHLGFSSVQSIYARMAQGTIPRPLKIDRLSGWHGHEVAAIKSALLGGATPEQMKAISASIYAKRKAEFEAVLKEHGVAA